MCISNTAFMSPHVMQMHYSAIRTGLPSSMRGCWYKTQASEQGDELRMQVVALLVVVHKNVHENPHFQLLGQISLSVDDESKAER
mmetsp:Transcript_8504/g.16129  ORF Transcript_8504/g.16129 Transcript_8504/m.16129 type:complete len:85 (+) Transcript_8504:1392-1646(+)